jgi:hypothetical protein
MKTLRKILLLATGLFALTSVFAQLPRYDSTRVPQINNAYGYEWGVSVVKGQLKPPGDTVKLAVKDSGSITVKNNRLWLWTGTYWKDPSSASSVVLTGIGSPIGTIAAAVGSIYTRTDGGVDSTVYFKQSGGSTSAGWTAVNASGTGSAGGINIDPTLRGTNTEIDPIGVDTIIIATKTDIANAVGIGLTAVAHDITLLNTGTGASPLKVDTTIIATLTALYKAIDSLALATGGTAPDGSETIILNGVGYTVAGSGTPASPYTFTITGTPSSNPFKAITIETYGAVANAATPGSGSNFTGTNNTPALNSAIAAADTKGYQWIICPPGDYLFSTPVDTIKGPKPLSFLFIGNVKLNGNDLFRVVNGSKSGAGGGAYEQHKFIFEGQVDGRANQPSHSYSTYIAGTGPVWSGYTNVLVKLINVNQSYVETNKATGLKAVVELIGSDGAGSQENTVIGRFWPSNKYGVLFTSLDGNSYVDKNKIKGPQGGTLRIGGYQPFWFDGFSGSVGDGPFNGAFRSDEIEAMLENFEEMPGGNGDITEPTFKLTIEGGPTTGCLNASSKFTFRSVSPNYVRSPKFEGQGYIDAGRMGSGSSGQMGLNGTINQAIWSPGSTVFYGNRAKIDGTGRIIVETPVTTSASTRGAAPSYVKFVNELRPQATQDLVANHTVAADDYFLMYNGTIGTFTVTLPSVSTSVGREITIYKGGDNTVINFSGTMAGVDAIGSGGKGGVTIFCDGSFWRTKSKWHD